MAADFASRLQELDLVGQWQQGLLPEPHVHRLFPGNNGGTTTDAIPTRTAHDRQGLVAFNAALLGRLLAEHRAKFISYLDGGVAIDWCSLCAGADVPILGVSCLKDALYVSSGCVANMPELYTAEKCHRKRHFRMTGYRDMPEHMFGDLADLASGDYALG